MVSLTRDESRERNTATERRKREQRAGPCVAAVRGPGFLSRMGTRRKAVRGADRVELARQVAEMRQQGMSYRAIASELGYGDSKSIRNLMAASITLGDTMAGTHTRPSIARAN